MEKKRVRILSLREMFDKIFDIHRKTIGCSLPYIILMQIIMGIVMFFCMMILLVPIMSMGFIYDGIEGISGLIVIMFILMIILIIIFSFMSQNLLSAGLIKIGSDGYFGNKTKFGKAISFAFSKFGKIFGVSFAETITLGAWLSPVLILGYIIGRNSFLQNKYLIHDKIDTFNQPKLIIAAMIILIIISALIIVVFITLYALAIPVVLYEDIGMFKAMKRSRMLVKERFWGVMGRKLLVGLVVQGVSTSLISILGIIGAVAMFLLRNSMTSESVLSFALVMGNLLRYPVQILLASCITPITAIFTLVLYYNIKFEKEGYDFEVNLFFMDKEKGSIENVQ
ncbi:hypothetical protein [Oceanirhabdus seepicola]|uniref:Glycerophosphoryl diester phosphodiesterase membrane domain-containing protein n=1 Tax=Oceanirhabdus seepicola TaxID=2828781 RepID=A0A9J6P2P2_9CLOT|nr:hypothetical protein [Oceanirhabdus seepicola]MCM1990652.1 hypothetical protein [Oceanirhabdus seepicola]